MPRKPTIQAGAQAEAPAFEVGDPVKWTSQAGGYERTKVGEVVEVVPAGVHPLYRRTEGLAGKFNLHPMDGAAGSAARGEVSYLVAVPAKSPRGARKLYWPVTSLLRPA